ncbi:MAG: YeeE/YedE family protein [Methylobacter sp.]|nr:YeeE/YedE family protein [Methylobacter sp.]
MENFTPYSALVGGALIGLSAALLMLLNGRIAGISGIIGRALPPHQRGDIGWRLFFLTGLLLGPLSSRLVVGNSDNIRIDTPLPVLIIAGLLVGYGTSLGSGCTSGHGVCGLARLSPRSAAATLIFMFVAGITVYIVRHWIGVRD